MGIPSDISLGEFTDDPEAQAVNVNATATATAMADGDLNLDHYHDEEDEESSKGGNSSTAGSTLVGGASATGHGHDNHNPSGSGSAGMGASKMVYIVLGVAAIAFGLATYFLLASSTEEEYRSEFQSYAREVAELTDTNADAIFGQMRSLATSVTSLVLSQKEGIASGGASGVAAASTKSFQDFLSSGASNNSTTTTMVSEETVPSSSGSASASASTQEKEARGFPFVTIPHWDLKVQEISELTGAEMFMWLPFVEEKDRFDYETYLQENQGWLADDFLSRGELWNTIKAVDLSPIPSQIFETPEEFDSKNDTRRGYVDDGFMEDILELKGYNSQNFAVPVAQYGPDTHDTSLIGMDLFTHQIFRKEFVSSLEYDVPVISEAIDLKFLLKHVGIDEAAKNQVANITTTNANGDDNRLRSFTLHEVKEDFLPDSRTVGFVMAVVRWDLLVGNNLPSGVNGIVVVVNSDCGSEMTFVVNGDSSSSDENEEEQEQQEYTTAAGKNPNVQQMYGDWHDPAYDDMGIETEFFWKDHPKGTSRHCHFNLTVYPSDTFKASYDKSDAFLYAGIVFAVFVFTAIVFFLYDLYILRGQRKLAAEARAASAVVRSLFPKEVAHKLMDEAAAVNAASGSGNGGAPNSLTRQKSSIHDTNDKVKLRSFVANPGNTPTAGSDSNNMSKPIADLFPSSTVLFADIVGFTAWSSTRDPTQVFTLLETLYNAFDEIARRRGIFKVETVGDCYVAVAGVPEYRDDHAVAMARFATDCVAAMTRLTGELEVELGPDTADLGCRVGIHSGPVTAGVLRGERARFQLFGDTMNTTARIESTGKKNRIHISKETAELLKEAGKSHWVSLREDKVHAKGKGELQTYWLNVANGSKAYAGRKSSLSNSASTTMSGEINSHSASSSSSGNKYDKDLTRTTVGPDSSEFSDSNHDNIDLQTLSSQQSKTRSTSAPKPKYLRQDQEQDSSRTINIKRDRLVSWNVEILAAYLKKMVAKRQHRQRGRSAKSTLPVDDVKAVEMQFRQSQEQQNQNGHDNYNGVLSEVVEIVNFPNDEENSKIDSDSSTSSSCDSNIELSREVMNQLRRYVSSIASLYHDNDFHNFEHASHVTLSVTKLLGRICDRGQLDDDGHNQTYGISSDPLTQFAVVLSAIIHDAAHLGVPNMTLVQEEHPLAHKYHGKSVAECNSIDLCWDLLLNSSEFEALRSCIYTNADEFRRFRQLMVNTVLATDIMDKELKALRNSRWEKAFDSSVDQATEESQKDKNDRRATIVIEHLIQASDVSHTMQHWHVYQKWNSRLFLELYKAYMDDRGNNTKDPSEGWYKGEMGFFDFYIIPLAKKLEECGVFGVSSDEYLNYALGNRREWEARGQEVVENLIKEAHAKYGRK